MFAVAIASSSNIVTGSTSCAGTETPMRSVPPRATAPPDDGVDVLLCDAEVPHAARIASMADAEMPRTLPRTSSCLRVTCPVRASSYRRHSKIVHEPLRPHGRWRPSGGSEAGTLSPIERGIKDQGPLRHAPAGSDPAPLMPGFWDHVDGSVGEAWSGDVPNGSHVNLTIGRRGSPTAAAAAAASARPGPGHAPVMARLGAGNAVRSATIVLNKATVASDLHGRDHLGRRAARHRGGRHGRRRRPGSIDPADVARS